MDLYLPPKPAIIRTDRRKLAIPPQFHFVVKPWAGMLMGGLGVTSLCGGGGASQPVITSISQVGKAQGTGSTLTCPSTLLGDMIVFGDCPFGGTTPSNATPSGFTQVDNITSATRRLALSYKVAAGTEGGTALGGMNGSTNNDKTCFVLRPNVPCTGITISSASEGPLSLNIPYTPDLSAPAYPAIWVITVAGSTEEPAYTDTPDANDQTTGGNSARIWWWLLTGPTSSISLTITGGGTPFMREECVMTPTLS